MLSFIELISIILFSILIQSLINEFNLLLSSFHSLSIIFPFSNDIFILFGNFSLFFIISSLQILLNYLSIFNKSSSSLSFKAFLILVKIFWIFSFISSLLCIIFSNIFFKSLIVFSKVFDKSSNILIFHLIYSFFPLWYL